MLYRREANIINSGRPFSFSFWNYRGYQHFVHVRKEKFINVTRVVLDNGFRRGTYFSLMSMTRHVMTTTAPMIGGVIAQKLTWRWIWWIMAIAGGIMVMLMFFFVPETLRSLVGNGSGYANPTPIQWWRRRRYLKRQQQSQQADDPCQPPIPDTATATNIPTTKSRKRINPFKSLIFLKEPDVMCALVFGGLCFGTQQSFMVTTANVLANVYHLSVMNVGLCFIVGGVGSFLGALTAGRMVDFEYRRVAIEFCGHVPDKGEISHDFPIFKARLRYPLCAAIIMQAAVMTFGWCVHTIQPLPVPLAMLFICKSSIIPIVISYEPLTPMFL